MNLQPTQVNIILHPCGTIQIVGPNGMVKLVPEDVVPLVNRPGLVNLMLSPMFLKPVDPVLVQRRLGELVFRVSDPEAGPVLDGKTDPDKVPDDDQIWDWPDMDDFFL
jgi:hypothetical protein